MASARKMKADVARDAKTVGLLNEFRKTKAP